MTRLLLSCSAALLLIACQPNLGHNLSSPGTVDGGPAPPGVLADGGGPMAQGCTTDSDCVAPLLCDQVSGTCGLEGQCGAMTAQASATPPNLLVVLDRSCSMKATAGWGGPRKWDTAVSAIDKLVTAHSGKMRFGLTLFPDRGGSACTQDSFPVPTGPGNEAKIKSLLQSALTYGDTHYPNGPCITNIDAAMQQAAKDPALGDPTRQSFVLLITDGKQFGCASAGGDTGTTKIIQDLMNKKVGTFVVGFGSGVDPVQLNIFAQAGGKPSAGTATQFYKAEDQTTLDQAMAAIAKSALGCQYTLQDVPATLQRLVVLLDSQPVAQDATHQDGWDYDPTTRQVTLYGQTCQDLQQGKAQRLDILLSCKAQAPDAGAPDTTPPCKTGAKPCTGDGDCPDQQVCLAGCCAKGID